MIWQSCVPPGIICFGAWSRPAVLVCIEQVACVSKHRALRQ